MPSLGASRTRCAGFRAALPLVAAALAACSGPPAEWPDLDAVRLAPAEPAARRLVLPSAYENYVLGQLASLEGDHDSAARWFRAALQTDPSSPYLHVSLALAELGRGRTAEARGEVDAALAEDPCNEFALSTAGQVLELQGDLEGAMRAYRRAIECVPRQPEPYLLLGDLLERAGSTERARQVYRAMLRTSASPTRARERLARVGLSTDPPAQAAAALAALVADEPWRFDAVVRLARLRLEAGQTTAARALLEAAISRRPRDSEARLLLIEVLLQAGDTAAAGRCLGRLRVDEGDTELGARIAALYLRARFHDAAAAEARRVLERDPSHPLALLVAGAAFRGLGETDEAVATLAGLGETDERADDARALAALALAEAGRQDQAVTLLRDRLARAPRSPLARRLLARLLERRGDLAGAEDALRAGTSPTEIAEAGRWLLDQGRAADAVALLGPAIDAGSAVVLALHAEALLLTGQRLDDAEASSRRALELAPRDPRVLAARGGLLAARGETEVGLELLERALCLAPGSAWVLWRYAEALEAAGRCEPAAELARRGSRLRPGPGIAGRLSWLGAADRCHETLPGRREP